MLKDEKSRSFSDFSKLIKDYEDHMCKITSEKKLTNKSLIQQVYCTYFGYGIIDSEKRSIQKTLEINVFESSSGESNSAIITQKLKLLLFGSNTYGQ